MKIIKYFVTMAVAAILAGCFEDKGNYDYKELYEPTLDYETNISFLIGDTLKNKLEITPVAPRTVDDYKVEWYVSGEKVGEGLELSIPNFTIRSGYSSHYFILEDLVTGIQFRNSFSINATAIYESGWAILSEENGETHLHFVRGNRIIDDDDNVTGTEFTLHKDVYTGLPNGPKRVVEHWCESTSILGEIAVICENNNVVELDGDFIYVVSLKDEFIDNTFPADLNVDNAVYMLNNSFVYTKDGAMYSRNNADPGGFHTGRYLNVPLYPGGGGMQVGFTVTSHYTNSYQALAYDSQNHRYLVLNDDNYGNNILSLISAYDGNEDTVAGNILLEDMGANRRAIACGSYLCDPYYYSKSRYYSIIKDDSDGKYYMHDFEIEVGRNTSYVTRYTQAELPWGAGKLSDETMIAVLPDEKNRVFFATGNNIYFNDKNADDPTLFKTFPAKITAIDFDICEYSWYTFGNRQLCVALENGEFYIFDISYDAMRKIINGGEPTELFKADGLGRIVDATYKMGAYPGWARG